MRAVALESLGRLVATDNEQPPFVGWPAEYNTRLGARLRVPGK